MLYTMSRMCLKLLDNIKTSATKDFPETQYNFESCNQALGIRKELPAKPPSTVASGDTASPMWTERQPPSSVGDSSAANPRCNLAFSTSCNPTTKQRSHSFLYLHNPMQLNNVPQVRGATTHHSINLPALQLPGRPHIQQNPGRSAAPLLAHHTTLPPSIPPKPTFTTHPLLSMINLKERQKKRKGTHQP
jgi:hypothetical protein